MQGHAPRNTLPILPAQARCAPLCGAGMHLPRGVFCLSIQKKSQLGPLLHPDTQKVSHNFGRLHVPVKIASRSECQQLHPTLIQQNKTSAHCRLQKPPAPAHCKQLLCSSCSCSTKGKQLGLCRRRAQHAKDRSHSRSFFKIFLHIAD